MVDQPGVRFGLATGGLVLALLVVAPFGLGPGETASVALVTAAAASATLPWTLAAALGTEAWAFFTGFFENRYGVLTLADADLLHLAVFVLGTVLIAHLIRTPLRNPSRGDRP